jgi:hypothetical protein
MKIFLAIYFALAVLSVIFIYGATCRKTRDHIVDSNKKDHIPDAGKKVEEKQE